MGKLVLLALFLFTLVKFEIRGEECVAVFRDNRIDMQREVVVQPKNLPTYMENLVRLGAEVSDQYAAYQLAWLIWKTLGSCKANV